MNNYTDFLFQEKKIKFCEGSNQFIDLLRKLPIIRNKIDNEWFTTQKDSQRKFFGYLTIIFLFFKDIIKKFIYSVIFFYIPYLILGNLCPNILHNQEMSIIYFFVIMSTICGTIINTTMFSMTDRDYVMLKVIKVKVNFYYLERILYKMGIELIAFSVSLWLLGAGIRLSIMISVLTVLLRPVGECFSIFIFKYVKKIHKSRNSIHGLLMSAAFLIAYLLPYINRNIINMWSIITNTGLLILFYTLCLASLLYLFFNKNYEAIILSRINNQREENIK